MAEINKKKKTAVQEQKEAIAKKVLQYKLGSEASVVAMMFEDPNLLKESNLTENDFHTEWWKVYFRILTGIVITE